MSAPQEPKLTEGVYAHAPKEVLDELALRRASIDNIDNALLHILAERFKQTGAVGVMKAAHNLEVSDRAREDAQAERMRAMAEKIGLDPDFAERFIRFLIEEVLKNHRALRR